MKRHDSDLPVEIADWFTKPFARFLKIEAAAGVGLLMATIAALFLSNSAYSTSYFTFWETPFGIRFGSFEIALPLRQWVNDGLMTFFFFVVALELKRELILGELQNLRMASLSLSAALGGMLIPASIYLVLMNGQPGMHGWGTVVATDTAFVIGCLALFGSRIPPSLRLFLLSLAIFDDVGAILVVAISYGESLNWMALAFVLLGLAVVAGAARIGIRNLWIYFVLGAGIWLGFSTSGIHPTIAGVILGLMTPARGWISDERLRTILERVLAYPTGDHWGGDTLERSDLRQAEVASKEALSPIERLEIMLHPWVGFVVMPIFALANAGIELSEVEFSQPVTLAIFAGLVLGKPIGVSTFSWIAIRLGLAARPTGLSWPFLVAGSLLTGIGFTMSLLIAGLSYSPTMLGGAQIALLSGSACSAVIGIALLLVLTLKKPKHRMAGKCQAKNDNFATKSYSL